MIHDGPVCSDCQQPYERGQINHLPTCQYAQSGPRRPAIPSQRRKVDNTDKADQFADIWPEDYPPYVREYRFVAVRFGIGLEGIRKRLADAQVNDFRFDFAWVDEKVAVGIDGRAWHVKGGGRHSTDKDHKKHNLATAWGWMFFHYSPSMLKAEPTIVVNQVFNALMQRRKEIENGIP